MRSATDKLKADVNHNRQRRIRGRLRKDLCQPRSTSSTCHQLSKRKHQSKKLCLSCIRILRRKYVLVRLPRWFWNFLLSKSNLIKTYFSIFLRKNNLIFSYLFVFSPNASQYFRFFPVAHVSTRERRSDDPAAERKYRNNFNHHCCFLFLELFCCCSNFEILFWFLLINVSYVYFVEVFVVWN